MFFRKHFNNATNVFDHNSQRPRSNNLKLKNRNKNKLDLEANKPARPDSNQHSIHIPHDVPNKL